MTTPSPDEALELLLQWPLVLLVMDGYEPCLAPIVTATISEQTEETLAVMIGLACERAREGVSWN